MTKTKNKYEAFWVQGAYGPEAAATLADLGSTTAHINTAVLKFYDTLMKIPVARSILDNLTPEEFEHLRAAQGRYLVAILSPELSVEKHKQMAIETGLRHSYIGLPAEVLAEASILYTDIATALVEGIPDPKPLTDIITRRLQYDLITQVEAYALVQYDRLAVHERILQLEHTANPLDFVQNMLETLHESFSKEVIGLALGSTRNGKYRHLLAKGRVPYEAVDSSLPEYPTIVAPEIQEAWFNEQSLIVNGWFGGTRVHHTMRDECMSRGIRSVGLFLMRDLQSAPKTFLFVCGRFPGYFLDKNTLNYWQQIADLFGTQLDLMERAQGGRRHRLADGLRFRQLLAREQVEVYYQPIVDPKKGRTVKLEGLARLKDGDKIILPGLFLSAFGASQLRDLFDIALKRVMEDLSGLPDTFPVCSLNLPPEAMLDTAWLSALPDHMMRLGATPSRICLEILELALADDGEIRDALFAIKNAGYSILLDDVGAGESSLLRLATLPVTGIKIDQNFVRTLQDSFDRLEFIIVLQMLALQRGLECVAEGVENADIIDILGSMSELLLQGYAYAKPMPADALQDWMKQDVLREPLPLMPQSLYGWYSRHVGRLFSLQNALYSISDLINIERLEDANQCPMHAMIPLIGGDEDIVQAHRNWHSNYALFVSMIHAGTGVGELWQAMDASKRELRAVVEKKIRPNTTAE